ncbi:MAG: chemotaxis response regulator protein-glutamate methylesterase [Zoogloeaceae bacterium]|jgi:two-component system chemotaxis response regulator CheB|nr:chemotaxis response regulator protein-glutamate methylesterase [Zoogloeaceae bacterium]
MSIRVLVIDDSNFMCLQLSRIISAAPDMEVVGMAHNAKEAQEMLRTLKPDVLTLDVNMPGMSGLEFLERLMRRRPMPVVMVSSCTREGSDAALKALELGALDFIDKPRLDASRNLEQYSADLAEKIRGAKNARLPPVTPPDILPSVKANLTRPTGNWLPNSYSTANPGGKLIFLGASTGGTEALKKVLLGMPANCPPILIVQHVPETFSAALAANLNRICRPEVIEAQGEEIVEAGMVYLTRGNHHMQVKKQGDRLVTELTQTPPVNGHRPSVDVLFDSAAALGKQAIGVILTGMGKDGAQGLLRMKKAGARTFGQNEASCVVYGMPREAFLLGAVDEVVDISQIAERVLALFGKKSQ